MHGTCRNTIGRSDPIGRRTSEPIVTTLLTYLPRDPGAGTAFLFTGLRMRLLDRTDRYAAMSGRLLGASRTLRNPLTIGCRWHRSCPKHFPSRPWRSGRPATQGKVGPTCRRRASIPPTRAITRRRRTTRRPRTTTCRRRITTSRGSTTRRRRTRRQRRSTASRRISTRRARTSSRTNRERAGSTEMSIGGGSR